MNCAKLILAIILLICSNTLVAQQKESMRNNQNDTTCLLPGEEALAYAIVEQKPLFNEEADLIKFQSWLYSNFLIPPQFQEASFQGTIVVEFIVNRNGYVCGAKILRPLDRLLDAEALRVINESPQWTPAIHRGKNVSVRILIPIRIKL